MSNKPLYSTLAHALLFVMLALALSACQTIPDGEESANKKENRVLQEQAEESLASGQADLAIKQFEQLVIKYPETKHAFTNLGLLYMGKQQTEQAKKSFLNAIEQDKNDAVAYNNLAVIQRQEGLFQEALLNYKSAINIDSNYANAHLNLGILYDIYLQNLPEAVAQYEHYQRITKNSNKDVEKWLIDTKRRIDANKTDINKTDINKEGTK